MAAKKNMDSVLFFKKTQVTTIFKILKCVFGGCGLHVQTSARTECALTEMGAQQL